ncbi:MAG: hypothetical protein J6386_18505 [Candidatus Synoicihabitans palmerolidicus]|nr:hypothetical protein [Candidatus Synoicihabitans palmerolidicus]
MSQNTTQKKTDFGIGASAGRGGDVCNVIRDKRYGDDQAWGGFGFVLRGMGRLTARDVDVAAD